ncbi:probable aspartic protease At2g35615 [Mangifera indica]|uniref:probable aspartic protease At2g35615 n=1 Tax=Mangifera indica TaxID=29780 RepID=UPI001CFB5FB5|nr:probable aspartic protease At2g35615 [Mangifera indica]
MNICIGTPPVVLIGVADTGTDLMWLQCKPCKECYKQKPPLFGPKRSSTYKTLTCASPYCSALEKSKRCESDINLCGYNYTYGDKTFTVRNLAVENFAIGDSTSRSPVTLPNVVFGCGHNNGGNVEEAESVHFSGNADLKLQPYNAFIRVEEDLVCLTMEPADSFGIFGNVAQTNFLVGFDLQGKIVSFMPTDCSKQ